MKEENILKLREAAPTVFIPINLYAVPKPEHTLHHISIACGDGWFDLIYNLAVAIEKENRLLASADDHTVAVQVKEKFGSLRFYVNRGSETINSWIQATESKASQTCDECGKPGTIRGKHWLRCRCEEHTKKEDKDSLDSAPLSPQDKMVRLEIRDIPCLEPTTTEGNESYADVLRPALSATQEIYTAIKNKRNNPT